jgi:hypothetical protein
MEKGGILDSLGKHIDANVNSGGKGNLLTRRQPGCSTPQWPDAAFECSVIVGHVLGGDQPISYNRTLEAFHVRIHAGVDVFGGFGGCTARVDTLLL